jgi:sulfate transporter 4
MGISWITFLCGLRYVCNHNRYRKYTKFISYFGPLFVVILSTSLTYCYNWGSAPVAIRITGSILAGLPGPTTSWFFPMTNFIQKLLLALIVFFIDLLESISIARALAVKNGYEISPSSEIRGLGIANIVGSCFSCYTSTGSFSRSSVNDTAGAKTQVAGFVTSIIIMIVLLCLTQLFYYLPLNAMAAIIISAMPPLFNFREFLYLWRVDKFDCLVFSIATLAVIFLGVEYGLAIAVGISLFLILLYSAFPRISVLGNVPGTESYRSVRQFPEAQELPEFLILRIDAPIYFANLNPIRRATEYYERRLAASGRELRYLVLDLSPCSMIDGPATHFLKSLTEENRKRGIQLILVQPNKSVVAELMRSGLDEFIGREYIGMNMHHILERVRAMDGLNGSKNSNLAKENEESSSSGAGYEYY